MARTILVVDSSVVIKWLFTQDEEYVAQADQILQNAQEQRAQLYAPELTRYEIGNILWKKKQLSVKDVQTLLVIYYGFPLIYVAQTEELAKYAAHISRTYDITYYDASFLALTDALHATLVTDNVKHQGKFSDISVIGLKDYTSVSDGDN